MTRYLRLFGWCAVLWGAVAQAGPSAMALKKAEELKQQAIKEHWGFKVGYTPALELPLESITGLRIPKNWREEATFYRPAQLRLPSSFDWRQQAGGLTPIKNQGNCGSCWAFGTVAVFESLLKIRDHVTRPLSEQQLLDCDRQSNGCGGGYFAHDFHVSPGAATDEEYPYEGRRNWTCRGKDDYPDKISDWGYVGGANGSPSVDEIKNAIYQYGPVAATVVANWAMMGYTGGIFDSCGGWITNHIVAIVGWNDADGGYWIMRNSWGKAWGEQGYMRIRYHCAKLGEQATFVNYKPKCSPQPIAYAGSSRSISPGGSTRLGGMPVEGQTYQWTPSTGLDDATSAMPLASPQQTTVYTETARTSCGSAEQRVTVTVGP